MKKVITFVALVCFLLLSLGATPPALPHAFYGEVDINGSSAPVGTSVEARGDGVVPGVGNPTITNIRGIYGTSNPYERRLIVQGNITKGTEITFYVNGKSTGQTYPFASGEVTELDLSVTITKRAPRRDYIETDLFGIEGSFRISSTGEILETIEATSEDGMLTMTIPEGTIALDIEGEPLDTLEVAVNESPPEPPEGTYLIEAYDFGPDGATFAPPITLTWSYDPETLPDDVDLAIAYYDGVNEEWVWVPCQVDTENNIITASIAHFTTFAIIAVPVEVPPVGEEEEEEEEVIIVAPPAFSVSYLSISPQLGVEPDETVAIAVLVANTGGESGSYTVVLKIDGVKEAEETVTVAAGESQTVTFSVTREEAGIYTVTVDGLSGSFTIVAPLEEGEEEEEEEEEVPAEPGVNWPLIGGIIGGVVVVLLGIYFLWFRRRHI